MTQNTERTKEASQYLSNKTNNTHKGSVNQSNQETR